MPAPKRSNTTAAAAARRRIGEETMAARLREAGWRVTSPEEVEGTMKLPTADEMLASAEAELDKAYRALGDAADWLRSDWTPVGSSLTKRQADRRTAMFTAIAAAKAAINEAH